jgi:outer membrane protein TolC
MSLQATGLGRRALAAGLAFATGACAVGPDYKRPAAPVPQAFRPRPSSAPRAVLSGQQTRKEPS